MVYLELHSAIFIEVQFIHIFASYLFYCDQNKVIWLWASKALSTLNFHFHDQNYVYRREYRQGMSCCQCLNKYFENHCSYAIRALIHPPEQKTCTSSFSCWTLKDVISSLSSWWFQVTIACIESNKWINLLAWQDIT